MQGVLYVFNLPCCPFGPFVSCVKKICVPSHRYGSKDRFTGNIITQAVQNLGETFAHRYDITFDGRNLCPGRLLNHREAMAVIKEKWEEVCGEYDGPPDLLLMQLKKIMNFAPD